MSFRYGMGRGVDGCRGCLLNCTLLTTGQRGALARDGRAHAEISEVAFMLSGTSGMV